MVERLPAGVDPIGYASVALLKGAQPPAVCSTNLQHASWLNATLFDDLQDGIVDGVDLALIALPPLFTLATKEDISLSGHGPFFVYAP